MNTTMTELNTYFDTNEIAVTLEPTPDEKQFDVIYQLDMDTSVSDIENETPNAHYDMSRHALKIGTLTDNSTPVYEDFNAQTQIVGLDAITTYIATHYGN